MSLPSVPLAQNVGIDVSKSTLDACLCWQLPSREIVIVGSIQVKNDKDGFESLWKWVQKHRDGSSAVHFTMEATGVYHESLAYWLSLQELRVSIVLPSRAKKYADSLEQKSKTDKLDARWLAQMGVERLLEEWVPPSPFFRSLRYLTRERQELVEQKTALKNQIHALEHGEEVLKSSLNRYKKRLKDTTQTIKEIEQEIKKFFKDAPELAEKLRKVLTIPGVSFITVATVLAETGGFVLFRGRKQLVSYSGLDVKIRQSGLHRGKERISKQGNSRIRRALFMPGVVAKQHNEPIREFSERIIQRNGEKSGMKATVASSRKLLCLIYSLWKSGEEFDPDYEWNKKQNRKIMTEGLVEVA